MDTIYWDDTVLAGFTAKPDHSDLRRNAMVEEAARTGGYVVRPCLVHGTYIAVIDRDFLAGRDPFVEISACDGSVTCLSNVTLTSTHGDCLPVYLRDPVRGAVGLAHAGWRGTADGVAGALLRTMCETYGSDPADLEAVIGPGIGLCHFEVDADVAERFRTQLDWCEPYLCDDRNGKYHIDLKAVNAGLLRLGGVRRIRIDPACTFCDEERYYSYRRCGDTSRMLSYIKIR